MTDIDMNLRVNGRDTAIRAPEDATLLEVLRYRLGFQGARFGCGQEQCGACMVLIDGVPTFACTRHAASATDQAIETVDGLRQDDPVLLSILDHQAAQCAFCLPGIVMSAKALLRREPHPKREDVVNALEPHLCRCGAHQRIVNAIMAVETP